MKKIFTILLVAVTCLVLSSCGVKKGDGSRFYAEHAGTGDFYFYIQHSTMHCPAIKNGTKTGKNFGWYYTEKSRNTFCSKCMDDSLVAKWTRRYEELMATKNKK